MLCKTATMSSFLPLLDVLNDDKTINRRALGKKVFGNQVIQILSPCYSFANDMSDFFKKLTRDDVAVQERLKALTDIVWPEIALLVKQRINQARDEGIVWNYTY